MTEPNNNMRKLVDGRRLWEIDHPFYCSEGGFYGGGDKCNNSYDSLDDFLNDWSDLDVDLNLVFRWDWRYDEEFKDEGYISIHIMIQRKGFHVHNHISNVERNKENEEKLIKFLTPHWKRLKEMWEPISWWDE